jgi:hypothetical protein
LLDLHLLLSSIVLIWC